MTRNTYRIVAAVGVALGGLAAMIFAIANFKMGQMTGSVSSTIYAVLLILVTLGAIAMNILLYTKLKDEVEKYGLFFAILPIWAIEAFSLLAINYADLGGNGAAIATLILTFLIIITGSIGFNLMRRGHRIPGRILTTIFLAIVFIGTIINFTGSGDGGLFVFGNVLRLLALVPICIVLYAPVRDGVTPSAGQPRPAPQQPKYEKPAAPKVEPVEPKKEEPKQSLREKLLEAKALYDDGLISEEEYAEIKKQAIENK